MLDEERDPEEDQEEGQEEGGEGQENQPPAARQEKQNQPPAKPKVKTPPAEQTYETWFAGLGEDVKKLVEGHIAGLRNAAESRKDEIKALKAELKGLRDAATEGSELRTKVEAMEAKIDQSDQKADFYEQAHGKGVRNLRLAWIAIQAEDGGLGSFQDRKGAIDFEMLEEKFPELFVRQTASVPPPDTKPGGSGSNPPRKALTMDQLIRRKTGRAA